VISIETSGGTRLRELAGAAVGSCVLRGIRDIADTDCGGGDDRVQSGPDDGLGGSGSETLDSGDAPSATNRHPESKNPSPYYENGDESESTDEDPLDHWFRGDEDGEAAA
jgi:hypothetical protein